VDALEIDAYMQAIRLMDNCFLVMDPEFIAKPEDLYI
jgi:hypothetical protein